MAGVFDSLLEFKWRGISFPVTQMSVSLTQDKAEHKSYRRQGANIESTGRQSLVFRATIPFKNNIYPAKSENWSVLYPDGYNRFFDAMAYPATGILTHPALGDYKCKPDNCEANWQSTSRDGVEVTASWVESIDLNEPDRLTVSQDQPLREVELSTLTLDVEIGKIDPSLIPTLPRRKKSLVDLVNDLTAYGDQTKIIAYRGFGSINEVAGVARRIQRSADLKGDPVLAPVRTAAIRMRLAAVALQRALEPGRSLVIFRVPQNTTIAGLASMVQTDVGNIATNNPRLLARPIVPAGTDIWYTKVAA